MKHCILIILLIGSISSYYSQKVDSNKILLSVWDYKMQFVGVYSIDSIYFNPKYKVSKYKEFVKEFSKVLNEETEKWFYVLMTNDSNEIKRCRKEMEQIGEIDYQYQWKWCYNPYSDYYKDFYHEAYLMPEILPDGHWFHYSTEQDKEGVYLEKFIKDKRYFNYFKRYHLPTKTVIDYYELKDGLLDGIILQSTQNNNFDDERKNIYRVSLIIKMKAGEDMGYIY